jgi:putative endonuclease
LRTNERDKPRDAALAEIHAGAVTGPFDKAGASARNGQCAEDLAAAYLAAHGLELLARNVRCKAGEIDLVCRDGVVLVLVEVRQRARTEFGGALASVAAPKRRKLVRAARFLLHTQPAWRRSIVRFDVVGVQGDPRGLHEIAWIKDAFRAG